jgi:hypothetical protein
MRQRRPFIAASAAAAAAFALLAAGCGGAGSGSPGVATVGTSTTTATTATGQTGLVAYSACMRSHGVAGFPDPSSGGGISKPQVVSARQHNPSAFDAADTACHRLLPADGSLGPPQTAQQLQTRLVDERSFAKCMRSHGVSRFPDPTAQGQLSVEMVQAQGIDVHSTAVLRVVQTCLPASHGALTPAKVREAIDHAGS